MIGVIWLSRTPKSSKKYLGRRQELKNKQTKYIVISNPVDAMAMGMQAVQQGRFCD
jgi:malate/lactate dehydrogenase